METKRNPDLLTRLKGVQIVSIRGAGALNFSSSNGIPSMILIFLQFSHIASRFDDTVV